MEGYLLLRSLGTLGIFSTRYSHITYKIYKFHVACIFSYFTILYTSTLNNKTYRG